MLRAISAVLLGAMLLAGACSDSKKPPGSWPDGLMQPDGQVFLDLKPIDLGAPPDMKNDPDGPVIKILSPKPKETVIGDSLKVQVEITDKDGINDPSVTATIVGSPPVQMTITATPNTYEAMLDISQLKNNARLIVSAQDLLGKQSNVWQDFQRDPGPTIQFLSPTELARYRGSVGVQVLVADASGVASLDVRVGSFKVVLTQNGSDPKKQIWVGSVKFDDPAFVPPLSGTQVLTAVAQNTNKATANAQRTFVVDNDGPTITIVSQKPGDLIGNVIQVKATVTDLAGVLTSSVKCVIGNALDTRTVYLKNSVGASGTFEGQFDTRTFGKDMLWPVMSFRAADKLGNESHADIEVGLDNGPPILALDPGKVRVWRIKDGLVECSQPFDPLGMDAANDLQTVPQIARLRARIEDIGNGVPGAPWVPIAGVDLSTTVLYVLDDETKALVIDSDGDGICDDVNPEVVPTGTQPKPGEAVAVGLATIPPAGKAFYPVATASGGCDKGGEDTKLPDPLCLTACAGGVDTCVTKVICYTVGCISNIYSIPPVVPTGLPCMGLPFDFKANSFSEGWVCAAAVARDMLGNRGVAPPLRLNVSYSGGTTTPGPAPSCTGTLDKTTGKVDATKPCTFRPANDYYRQSFAAPGVTELVQDR
jgi:hypothetical protein